MRLLVRFVIALAAVGALILIVHLSDGFKVLGYGKEESRLRRNVHNSRVDLLNYRGTDPAVIAHRRQRYVVEVCI